MPFVLDCSLAMAWVFPDESSATADALRDSLVNDIALVPTLWPIEVANVLLMATRRGRISADDWPRIQADLDTLPIQVDPETPDWVLKKALPLAHQHGLSVYDAVYLELALRMELPVATLDKKLGAACHAAGVKVL